MSSTRPRVVAVVPAFQEATRIALVIARLLDQVDEVVVVDDGSADATADAAVCAGALVVRHPINRGQGAALQTGIDFALARRATILVTFDADGQHDAADVERLVAPIRAGSADVVLGSRFLGRGDRSRADGAAGAAPGIPMRRRLVLKAAVVFTRLTAGLRVTDTHNGLRALSAAAAARLHLTLDRMAHASELLEQVRALQLRWCEVPVRVRYTAETLAKGQRDRDALAIAARVLWRRMTA